MDQIDEHDAGGIDLPILRGERLMLRLAGPGDVDALYRGLADFDVVRMLARVAWPVRRDALEAFLRDSLARAVRGDAFEMAIIPHGQKPVGVVGLEYIDGSAHIGYWLGRAWWGQGLMTEAVSLSLAHVFARSPGIRVISGVFSDNPASLRVQEKLGFEVAGSHMRWCEARRQDLKHIDTALDLKRFREGAR